MKRVDKKKKLASLKIPWLVFTICLMAVSGWAQNHDLVITTAPDITSAVPAERKSSDLKIGSDFGATTIPDLVQRGVPNSIYARFRVNGIMDYTIPSGDIEIKFYWRTAIVGSTPPALSDPSWHYIDKLPVTYMSSDGPFAVTRVWPTDFPSVAVKSVTWTPPLIGDYFHVAALLVYPASITDEHPDDNTAYSLYESRSGLLDIVLLHDVTGSMGYYQYGGFPYIQLAISKASLFIASLNENHRLAAVAFCSNFVNGWQDVWPTSSPMMREATDTNKGNALAAIAGLTAQGATPLGQGLQRAIQILISSPPERKRVIILLSDGEENYGTPQACSGADPASPCISSSILSQLQTNHIKVFTIALGTSAWTQCLECLALQTGGQWYYSPNASLTLAQVLLDVQQASSSDDLYRVDYGVSGGADDRYSTNFEGRDNALYFMLSWDDLKANLDLILTPPRPQRLKTEIFKGDGYLVIKVKNPLKGNWSYEVSGDVGKKYLVAVRSDIVGVRLGMEVEARGVVGTPLKIRAYLTEGGKPITNAQVSAIVQIPVQASLETIVQREFRNYILKIRALPVDPIVLKENPDISLRSAFLRQIAGPGQESLVKTKGVSLPLQPDGKGYYTGTLKEEFSTVAGEYLVTVTAADRGSHRYFTRQVRLNSGELNYDNSFAELVKVKTDRAEAISWLLQVYAVDRFGNAVTTPSLLDRVKAKVSGSLLQRPEIVFGCLQYQLSVEEGQMPVLKSVTLDGKEIKIREKIQ